MVTNYTTKKALKFFLTLFVLFAAQSINVKAQTYADGPSRLVMRINASANNYYGDACFGGAENRWKWWNMANADVNGAGWQGGACIQLNDTWGTWNQINWGGWTFDQYYNGWGQNCPSLYNTYIDAWEEDCDGNCDYNGCWIDGDDNHCGGGQMSEASNRGYRNLAAPCVWGQDGWLGAACGWYYVLIGTYYDTPRPVAYGGVSGCQYATLNSYINGAGSYAGCSYYWERSGGGGGIANANAQNTSCTQDGWYRVQYNCNGCVEWSDWFYVDLVDIPVGSTQANFFNAGTVNNSCGTTFTHTANNSTANCYANNIGQTSDDIYYRFTLGGTSNTIVNLSHCGSGFDTYMHLLNSAGTSLAVNDDNGVLCTGSSSSLQQTLAPGDYFVVSEGYSTNVGNITTAISIPTPSGGTITGTSPVCYNSSGVTYSISGVSNATRYVWTVPAGAAIASGQNTSTITVNFGTATSGTISCVPRNGDNCAGPTVNYSVTVTPSTVAPTFTAGPTSLCANATSTYTATTTQGTISYSIIGGSGAAINPTTGALTSAGTSNFTVRATSTNSPCGSLTTDRAVTVTPATGTPSFTVAPTSLCANATATYTATTSQGTISYSIIGGSGAAINSSTGALTSAGTSNFTVRATANNSPCGALTADVAVTVTPATVAPTFTAGPTSLCANGTATYTATTTQGTVTYSIIGGTGATINSTTGALTSAGTTNFTVRATSNNSPCGSLSTDRAVTVTPATVAPTFTVAPTSLCANATATYTATTTQGTISYSIIGGSGAAINSTTGALTSAGTSNFTVRATSTNAPCGALTTDVAVTVTPATVAPTFTAGPTSLCANGTGTYTATTTQGTVTYSIIGGSGAAIDANTGVLSSAGTANFTVRATSTNAPCGALTTDRAVTVTPATVAPTFTVAPTSLCANATATYTATTTQGTISYSIIGGTGAAINSTTGALTSAGTANFTVRATSTNAPCGALTTDVAVTVTPGTIAPTFTAGATTLCANGTDTYTATTSQGTVTYSIIGGSGASINPTTGVLTSAGTANFTVRATSTNAPCGALTTDRAVTVRPAPTASVSVTGTNPVCQTGSSTVRFSGTNGTTVTYNINGGSNSTASIVSGGFVDIGTGALSVNSTYNIVDVFYTDNSPSCTATPGGSATVTVVTGPIQRTVQVASTTICSGTPGSVQVLSSESGTVYQLYNTTTNANVGSTQTGNGSTLSFSTGNLTSNSTFKIIASRAPCTALDMNNGVDVDIYVVSNGYWKGAVSSDWFDGGNWCLGGGIPTNVIDVFIPNAATTDYDPNINNTGAVTRSINIESSGVLSISGSRNLDVWGDWNNSGTFNYNASTVTFKGTGNANLTGFTDPQEFNNLKVDKGTTATPLLDMGVNVTVYGALQPTNGLAKVSAGDLTLSTTATTIASTAAVEINGGNLVAGSNAFTNNGAFRVVTGNADIASLTNASGSTYNTTGGITTIAGNVANTGATVSSTGGSITANGDWSNASTTTTTYNGSTIAVVGNYSSTGSSVVNANSATVSVGGNYTNTSSTLSLGGAIVVVGGNMVNTTGTVNQTGGAITFNTTGGSFNSNAVLHLDGGSNLNISSGTMYFQRANGGTGNDLVILSGAGTKAITGGTFQFGNATTPASQVFKVNNSVVDFNNLTINGNNTPTVQLLGNAATGSAGVLTVNGVLNLNQYTFTVKNSATSAVTGSAYILSEATSGNSKLAWNIGNNTGSYVFPFGTAAGAAIPFTFNVTTGGAQNGTGNVTVSTYPSSDDNTPWVSGVGHMNFVNGPGNGTDATLDRWWVIDANNYTTKPVSTMTFKYADADLTGNSAIVEGSLKAQRWNAVGGPSSTGGWDDPATFGSNTNNAGANTVTVAGVYNYSPWVLHDGESGGNSPLPIELVEFKASCTNDVVTINWTTATEVNNDYFTVQRSADLTNYTNVAIVEGAGNSNTLLNYVTKDNYPMQGTSYYRLMQTDYDGQFEIFNPVAVMCITKQSDVISVFPNPANDKLNVTMNLTANDRGRILIYNHFGQLVESLFVEPKAGANTYSFDLNNLNQGQYMVSFMMEGKVLPTQKVIISR